MYEEEWATHYTYCDFGKPDRVDKLQRHRSEGAARRQFKRARTVYHKIHGWRLWVVNLATNDVILDTARGD